MANIVTVSLVGAGRMGRRHLQGIKNLGYKIQSVCDASDESLKAVHEELEVSYDLMTKKIEEVLNPTPPDCLIIATTADSHCDLTCQAAAAGVKYVLVEKPMAVSLEQCDRMIETCEKNGTLLAVNHQMRFMEQYTLPKQLLYSDEYGGFTSMNVVAGNFGVSMNGAHYVEAFRFLADENPVEVSAWFSSESVPNPRGERFLDRAGAIRAVTSSGKRFYMEIGADQGHGIRATYAARNGMITINELTGEMLTTVREEQYRDLPTTRYGMPAINGNQLIKPAEVVDSSAAVLNALVQGKNNVTGEVGRLAVEVLVAAYQSSEDGGKTVRIDSGLDRNRIFPWA